MTCRTILQWPNKQLAETSSLCGEVNEEVISNVRDVVDTLRASFGVGLAAPQIGIKKRILAIAPSVAQIENPYPQEEFPDHFVVIDPELSLDGHDLTWSEACLSVPFVSAPVKRKSLAKLTFTNLKGERVSLDLRMPLSGVMQHEYDHLDGILFIDRAGKFVKQRLVKKLEKEKRILKREKELERRQIILDVQGPAALRKYLSQNNSTKKKSSGRKKTSKKYGKNKKLR